MVASAALEGLLAPLPETLSRVDTGLRPPRCAGLQPSACTCCFVGPVTRGSPCSRFGWGTPIFASGSGRSRRAKPGLRCDGVTHPRWSLSPVKSARPCDSSGWGQCGPEPGGRLSRGWRPGCGGRGHSPCPAPPRCVLTPPHRGPSPLPDSPVFLPLQSRGPSPSEELSPGSSDVRCQDVEGSRASEGRGAPLEESCEDSWVWPPFPGAGLWLCCCCSAPRWGAAWVLSLHAPGEVAGGQGAVWAEDQGPPGHVAPPQRVQSFRFSHHQVID